MVFIYFNLIEFCGWVFYVAARLKAVVVLSFKPKCEMVNIIIKCRFNLVCAVFGTCFVFTERTSDFCGFVGALVSVRACYCAGSECVSESVRRDQF